MSRSESLPGKLIMKGAMADLETEVRAYVESAAAETERACFGFRSPDGNIELFASQRALGDALAVNGFFGKSGWFTFIVERHDPQIRLRVLMSFHSSYKGGDIVHTDRAT